MPRGDGTGPMGMGAMTGRGLGSCAGYGVPGYMSPGYRGIGFGRGRGFRRMHYAAGIPGWGMYDAYPAYPWGRGANYPDLNEKEYLSSQVETLENELKNLKKRLSVIENESE